MGKLKLDADYNKFFAIKYKDGIIVAFKNLKGVGTSYRETVDLCLPYADNIHEIVSKNLGEVIFVSDVTQKISGIDSYKDIIEDSLFIYVKKSGTSISAKGINVSQCKDCIEVKYDSEKVLTIHVKKRFRLIGRVCISFLLGICVYYVLNKGIDIIYPKKVDIDTTRVDVLVIKSEQETENKVDRNNKMEELEQKEKQVAPNVNISKYNEVEPKHEAKKRIPRDNKMSKEKLADSDIAAEAYKYFQKAERAYRDYADDFEDRKGAEALTNYKKALELDDKYGLFSSIERNRIKDRIKSIDRELNMW